MGNLELIFSLIYLGTLGVLWEVWDGVWALKQVLCLFKQCIIDVGLKIGCSEFEKCFRLKLRYEIRGVVDVRLLPLA